MAITDTRVGREFEALIADLLAGFISRKKEKKPAIGGLRAANVRRLTDFLDQTSGQTPYFC
jgi:hypothetical protein